MNKQMLLDTLSDDLDVVNGYIQVDIALTIEVEFYYLQAKLEDMIRVVNGAPSTTSIVPFLIQAYLEMNRTQTVYKYERKGISVFDQNDNDKPPNNGGDDWIHDDDMRDGERQIMIMVVGVKHIAILCFQVMLLFFFWCEINRSFISFRYCKFYVYVVYFLLIVQDFVLFAPAVWIFTYNMALMVLLLAVIVRQ